MRQNDYDFASVFVRNATKAFFATFEFFTICLKP